MTSWADKPVSASQVADLFQELATTWPDDYTPRMAYEDFNACFSTYAGRRALYRILEACGVYATPFAFVGGGEDRQGALSPELTFANIGRQDVARFILNVLINEPPMTPPATAETEDPSTKEN